MINPEEDLKKRRVVEKTRKIRTETKIESHLPVETGELVEIENPHLTEIADLISGGLYNNGKNIYSNITAAAITDVFADL